MTPPASSSAGPPAPPLPRRLHLRTLALLGAAMILPACDTLGPLPTPPAFMAVTTGGHHSCAVSDGGLAYCWGQGLDGALGQGGLQSSLFPVEVKSALHFTAISAGQSHTCALATDGSAWCWGSNAFYQRGNGSDTASAAPVAVAGGHLFQSIDAGDQHTCALTAAGQAFCWGYNRFGQLGDGTTNTSIGPEPVAGSLVFTRISAGGRHTCGLATDGSVYCWGDNGVGQLGTGSDTVLALTPRRVAGSYVAVSAGENHTCALAAGSKLYCWGGDEFGQLGNGAASAPGVPGSAVPEAMPAPGITFDTVRAGSGVTCASGRDAYLGSVGFCWGHGLFGQIGTGTTVDQYHPQTIHLQPGRQFNSELLGFSYVEPSGDTHACGLSLDRAVYCWGTGPNGELGSGSVTYSPVPVLVELAH